MDTLNKLKFLNARMNRRKDPMDTHSLARYWLEHATDPEILSELKELTAPDKAQELEDAFFQELSFGTAGLRGVLGAGTNRMNIYTVGKATQGLANYLVGAFDEPTVAIARDSRNKGELFVRTTATILAAMGIHVHIFPRIEPVPALSFAVRELETSAGIVMTASHNPAPYNGYKVYGPDGCQITSEAAEAISAAIALVDPFTGVKTGDFDEFMEAGVIDWIDDVVLDRFLDAELANSQDDPDAADVSLKLVYTPLCGSGLELNSRLFERIGVKDVTVVPEQKEPDGNFPTCPYPNPEIREAMQKGIECCERVHPDLLLATDPDADRCGVAVKADDDYLLLTGNEMGILMLDYLCKMHEKKGDLPEGAIAVSTIVSTAMIDAIAERYGVSIRRTLTGFKYIGEIINELVDAGHPERFLLGFEESYGYLAATHVRDKDSISASMVICQMAQHYKLHGMNLAQAIRALYEEYGYYRNKTVSISFPGAQGSTKMANIMEGLRERPLTEFAGRTVVDVVDYREGSAGLPPADVIECRLADENKVIFRPSGTEPKIKAYLFGKAASASEAKATIEELETAARTVLS